MFNYVMTALWLSLGVVQLSGLVTLNASTDVFWEFFRYLSFAVIDFSFFFYNLHKIFKK